MKHELLGELQSNLRKTPGFRESLEELAENGEEPSKSFASGLLKLAERYGL